MKLKFQGDMTLDEFGKLVADVVKDFLDKAEMNESQVKVNNPIVQTAFRIEGQEEAVFMATEHDEMLQVELEVADGRIVGGKDNQHEPTNDKRLWTYDKIVNEAPVDIPTEEITSDYDQTQIEFKEEFIINASLKQKIYRIVGTSDELIRYFNTEKNVLIAEEVVSDTPKQDSEVTN